MTKTPTPGTVGSDAIRLQQYISVPRHGNLGTAIRSPLGLWCLLTLSTHSRRNTMTFITTHTSLSWETALTGGSQWLNQNNNFLNIDNCLAFDIKFEDSRKMICIHAYEI